MKSMPTTEQVTEALRSVIDPELRRSIVELGMVRSIEIQDSGRVEVIVSLTTAGCPIRSPLRTGRRPAGPRAGRRDRGRGRLRRPLRRGERRPCSRRSAAASCREGALAQVKNVICVASGKGGVGKSTMTANLAAALTAEGHPAGALDCDVYGYSIPRMLGVNAKPEVNGERKILPLDAPERRQGDVDRLLRRGERGRRLARPDAAQGDPAVPRGRRLGRAGVPAARPAARAPATSR